jgi:hypothetical protein
MLVDENWIFDLRVYSYYPVRIKCNQDKLLKCNNLVLPCNPIGKHYERSAFRYRVDGSRLKIHMAVRQMKLRKKVKGKYTIIPLVPETEPLFHPQ